MAGFEFYSTVMSVLSAGSKKNDTCEQLIYGYSLRQGKVRRSSKKQHLDLSINSQVYSFGDSANMNLAHAHSMCRASSTISKSHVHDCTAFSCSYMTCMSYTIVMYMYMQ